jgi:hypothetical protein
VITRTHQRTISCDTPTAAQDGDSRRPHTCADAATVAVAVVQFASFTPYGIGLAAPQPKSRYDARYVLHKQPLKLSQVTTLGIAQAAPPAPQSHDATLPPHTTRQGHHVTISHDQVTPIHWCRRAAHGSSVTRHAVLRRWRTLQVGSSQVKSSGARCKLALPPVGTSAWVLGAICGLR